MAGMHNLQRKQIIVKLFIYAFALIVTGLSFKILSDYNGSQKVNAELEQNMNTPSSRFQSKFIIAITTIIVFFVAFIYTLGYGNIGDLSFIRYFFIHIIIGVFVILFFYTIFRYLSSTATLLVYFLLYFILAMMVIVVLSILFNVMYNNLFSDKNTISNFIIEFIFFIPCLFNDFVKYVLEQLKITPPVTYVLLAIEFVLILLYVIVSKYARRIVVPHNGIVLQDEPYFINTGRPKAVASMATLNPIRNRPENVFNQENPFSKNYAFSMWIQMNPQNVSNEIHILKYGSENYNNNKPLIAYSYNYQMNRDVYRIYHSQTNYFEISVQNQKWNHFVLNYNDNGMDLYVNGRFEKRAEFTNDQPVYLTTDQVTIGDTEETGINGAICSVVYFDKNVTEFEIKKLYNLGSLTIPYPGKI